MFVKRNSSIVALVIAVTAVLSGPTVRADFITGVTASASSYDATREPLHLVDNSGLDLTDPSHPFVNQSVVANDIMWNVDALGTAANTWVKFDLGAVKPIGQMWVWNYNAPGYTNRGFSAADIWYATTTPTVDNPTDANHGNWTRLYKDYSFDPAGRYPTTSMRMTRTRSR